MAIIPWNKKYGETLKLSLLRFRNDFPEYLNSKVTYAGRLDPMAEGLVILLTDDDVYKKEAYLGLDKTYVVEFILGVTTDSYDILGLITAVGSPTVSEAKMEKMIGTFPLIHEQQYPAYSSKTVEGKPLWQWAREGRTEHIKWPSRAVEIFEAHYQGSRELDALTFKKEVIQSIESVDGDFRQEEILESWNHFFDKNPHPVRIYQMTVHASSGTYMRTLVDTLGSYLGTGATSLRIKRIGIGPYQQTIDK